MNANLMPSQFPNISWSQIRLMIIIAVGLAIFIFLFRRVFNVLVIDICILGNYSACKCCSLRRNRLHRQEEEGDSSSPPNGRTWSTRDAIILSKLGAFTDPFHYFYSLSDEKKGKLLEVIMEKEVRM